MSPRNFPGRIESKTLFNLSNEIISNVLPCINNIHLKFNSLNTHGALGNREYISDLLATSDLLFISETWLLEDQHNHFKNLSNKINWNILVK